MCKSQSMSPPTEGWRVPWDGPLRPTLQVQSKAVEVNTTTVEAAAEAASTDEVDNAASDAVDNTATVEAAAEGVSTTSDEVDNAATDEVDNTATVEAAEAACASTTSDEVDNTATVEAAAAAAEAAV